MRGLLALGLALCLAGCLGGRRRGGGGDDDDDESRGDDDDCGVICTGDDDDEWTGDDDDDDDDSVSHGSGDDDADEAEPVDEADDDPYCGDGYASDWEWCDGGDLVGATCATATLGERECGVLFCGPDCYYDTLSCYEC